MNLSRTVTQFGAHWLMLFAGVLIAWFLLYAMSVPLTDTSLPASGDWHSLHHTSAGDTAMLHLFGMWALMAIAMMAPSMVPMLHAYTDLISAGAGRATGFYFLLGGYLLVWLVFAVGATWLQTRLDLAGVINTDGKSVSLWFNATLLTVTGAYQFSPIKEACLNKCRQPLGFFMAHWRAGATGALQMGVHLGVICLFCCWALMLLGFVGGVMSLLWMGAATVLMTLEKLPQIGRYLTRPVGVLLLLAGGWFVFLAATAT